MNRQQEHSCIAYFKSNPVWNRVFRGFWEKYRSYGTFSGKVVLQKLTAEEVEGLEGFFAKSFHGKKSIKMCGNNLFVMAQKFIIFFLIGRTRRDILLFLQQKSPEIHMLLIREVHWGLFCIK